MQVDRLKAIEAYNSLEAGNTLVLLGSSGTTTEITNFEGADESLEQAKDTLAVYEETISILLHREYCHYRTIANGDKYTIFDDMVIPIINQIHTAGE